MRRCRRGNGEMPFVGALGRLLGLAVSLTPPPPTTFDRAAVSARSAAARGDRQRPGAGSAASFGPYKRDDRPRGFRCRCGGVTRHRPGLAANNTPFQY